MGNAHLTETSKNYTDSTANSFRLEKEIDKLNMKPAKDSTVDYKKLVAKGYDICANAYNLAREKEKQLELSLLTSQLNDGASVLDIGCGAGVPIAKILAERFAVTGVDISLEQISRAQKNVLKGRFIHGDIMNQHFESL